MSEPKNASTGENEGYAALGEELLRQQGLPAESDGALPQGAPVSEYPADEDIYREPFAPIGEYGTFSADLQEVFEEEYAAQEPAPEAEASEAASETAGVVSSDEDAIVEAVAGEAGPSETTGTVPDGSASAEAPADSEAADKTAAGPAPFGAAASAKRNSGQLWQTIFRPVVALLTICFVTSLLLGLTNELTAPIIAANAAAAEDEARRILLPDADSFEEMVIPEGLDAVTSIYRATNGVGWIIGAYGRGYGGQVPALIAFDEAGTIVDALFTENNETVGLGQQVREVAFSGQFAGRAAETVTLADVDKIASATISTNAAIAAVNAAVDAYHVVTGSGGGTTARPTETEDILEFLLPGQALTPITISALNVRPTAYRGENGDYIIFGEQPNESPDSASVVVAAVAMDSAGVILNLWLDTSGEGEGYGQTLSTNQSFISGFIGQSAPVAVNAVADITGSSNYVSGAVNNALSALGAAKEAA